MGCIPWGRKESDTTERLHFQFSLSCTGEENGNPLQCSCLENPRDGGTWWAAVYGVAQSRTRLTRLSSSSSRYFRGELKQRLWGKSSTLPPLFHRALLHYIFSIGFYKMLNIILCYTVGPRWLSIFCISSVESLSRVRLFATPRTATPQASLFITSSQNLLKLISKESVMPIQPSHPLSSPFPPAFNLSQHQGLFQ